MSVFLLYEKEIEEILYISSFFPASRGCTNKNKGKKTNSQNSHISYPDVLTFCFRWLLCANHTEPVKGFLGRFLRRKLLETEISSRTRNADLVKIIEWIPCVWEHLNHFLETHSSSDVTIGESSTVPASPMYPDVYSAGHS